RRTQPPDGARTTYGRPARAARETMTDLNPTADDPGPRPLSPHEQTIRCLSDRLAAAQRPLRILPAVRWPASVEVAFFAAGGRELPPVTADTYYAAPLPFDPAAKIGRA